MTYTPTGGYYAIIDTEKGGYPNSVLNNNGEFKPPAGIKSENKETNIIQAYITWFMMRLTGKKVKVVYVNTGIMT